MQLLSVKSDGNPLVLAAERLAGIDPQLSRTMHLEALGAAISAGHGDTSGELRALAVAASTAPPTPGAPRPADLLLDALVVRLTNGYAAAATRLAQAGRTVIGHDDPDAARWRWLASRIVADLWDDEGWRLETQLGAAAPRSQVELPTPFDRSVIRSAVVEQYDRAVLANARGRYADAVSAAQQVCQHHDLGLHGLALSELVEAGTRALRIDLAANALAQLSDRAQASGTGWALGTLARARAQLSRGSRADDLFQESIARLTQAGIGLDLARSHLLYGEWLRREGRRVDARKQLRSAHSLFESLDAFAFGERTQSELLATGETVRKRTFSSCRDLTPQEERIAQLAASRFTNAEIATQLYISARTVEWHLAKIFTKLGVSSRRELGSLPSFAPAYPAGLAV